MRRGHIRALVCLGSYLLLAGCSHGDPAKGRVTGTITLDDQPLEAGNVQFVSADHTAPNASAQIKDGSYVAEVPVGKMLVQISWLKVVGQHKAYDTPDSPMRDEFKEQIPAKYNVSTELSIEVKSGGQKHDFALKSR